MKYPQGLSWYKNTFENDLAEEGIAIDRFGVADLSNGKKVLYADLRIKRHDKQDTHNSYRIVGFLEREIDAIGYLKTKRFLFFWKNDIVVPIPNNEREEVESGLREVIEGRFKRILV